MSITFKDLKEAVDYAREKDREGYNTEVFRNKTSRGWSYSVYLGGKDVRKPKRTEESFLASRPKKMLEPESYYHLTQQHLGQTPTLQVRAADSMMEEYNFPGVSFSPSIKQSLESLPMQLELGESKTFYVYTPMQTTIGYEPETEDVEFSEEVRSPTNIKAKLLGKIKATNDKEGHITIKWIEKS